MVRKKIQREFIFLGKSWVSSTKLTFSTGLVEKNIKKHRIFSGFAEKSISFDNYLHNLCINLIFKAKISWIDQLTVVFFSLGYIFWLLVKALNIQCFSESCASHNNRSISAYTCLKTFTVQHFSLFNRLQITSGVSQLNQRISVDW